jgi:hypothetical protein
MGRTFIDGVGRSYQTWLKGDTCSANFQHSSGAAKASKAATQAGPLTGSIDSLRIIYYKDIN